MTPLVDWERCRSWLKTAIDRTGFYDISDVERGINEGHYTFWPGDNAAAITEIITYPNGKALNVFAGGGDNHASLAEFMQVFEPALVKWAEVNSCRWIMGYGRPGWEKPCGYAGYKKVWTVMTKELEQA